MENEIVEKSGEMLLTEQTDDLVEKILAENNPEKTKEMIDLFNVNIAKKNAVRVVKLNSLIDKLNEQATDRISKRPDQISNKDLVSFINTMQDQVDKASSSLNSISTAPTIQVNNQHNEVNINVNDNQSVLNKESRDKVLAVIDKILNQQLSTEDNVVDVDVVIKDESEEQNG